MAGHGDGLAQGKALFAGLGDKSRPQGMGRHCARRLVGRLGAAAHDVAQRSIEQRLDNRSRQMRRNNLASVMRKRGLGKIGQFLQE